MDQVTALYALVSFLVLLITLVSFSKSKSEFGPRDEYTFILVLRAASLPASWQRREISTMALAPFGRQRYSDLELLTRFRFHVVY